jgi:hypothetical protein
VSGVVESNILQLLRGGVLRRVTQIMMPRNDATDTSSIHGMLPSKDVIAGEDAAGCAENETNHRRGSETFGLGYDRVPEIILVGRSIR